MTNFEKAFISACKAFMAHYDLVSSINSDIEPPPSQDEYEHAERAAFTHAEATPSSNGVPICSRHGRAMKPGKFGYFCSTKESDPRYANKNGWCNAKA